MCLIFLVYMFVCLLFFIQGVITAVFPKLEGIDAMFYQYNNRGHVETLKTHSHIVDNF